MRRIILLVTVAVLMTAMLAFLAGTAAAHPHVVKNPDHEQTLAAARTTQALLLTPKPG